MLAQWSLPWLFSLIFGLFFAIVIIIVCAYGIREVTNQVKKTTEAGRGPRSFSPRPAPRQSLTPSTTRSIQLAMCHECEATILAEATVCPHCGASRPVCSVCHLFIEQGELILLCPHCKSQAHRIHILEYLKVKGTCPHCQSDLDEFELISK